MYGNQQQQRFAQTPRGRSGRQTDWQDMLAIFQIRHKWLRIFLAEVLGTALLIVIGDGAVAQSVLGHTDYLGINFAYGLAVAFGVYVALEVSGGHLNPAISLALCVISEAEWIHLPVYFCAQYLGAFLGAGIVYGTYYDKIRAVDYNLTVPNVLYNTTLSQYPTAQIFATYKSADVTIRGAFVDQVVGTAILCLVVTALIDKRHSKVEKNLLPLLVGLAVAAIGMSFGINCGYAINPARDLAPRLFSAAVGYGSVVFTAGDHYAWVPVVGPHVGAIFGGFLYKAMVSIHPPDQLPPKTESVPLPTENHKEPIQSYTPMQAYYAESPMVDPYRFDSRSQTQARNPRYPLMYGSQAPQQRQRAMEAIY